MMSHLEPIMRTANLTAWHWCVFDV